MPDPELVAAISDKWSAKKIREVRLRPAAHGEDDLKIETLSPQEINAQF